MSVLLILILASLGVALAFLGCFIWAVKSGQFEDTCTPSMRILGEDQTSKRPAAPATTQPTIHGS
jgi:cbb3-type cytochrome oxidase maturation protein